MPRHYFKRVSNDVQLHVFCDSSILAYGAVACLRCNTPEGTKCTFQKARQHPWNNKQCDSWNCSQHYLKQNYQNTSKAVIQTCQRFQTVLWSDSQITLFWILSTKALRQQFIRYRVRLINDITSPSVWRFCPTSSNPADIIDRGVDAKAFISKKGDWNHCPSCAFLRTPQEWPSNTNGEIQDTESTIDSTSMIANLTSTQENVNVLIVINITRYNTLNKTLRITALVIHFVKKLRGYTNGQNTITAMDLNYACVTVVKSVQQIHCGEIISTLKHKDKR